MRWDILLGLMVPWVLLFTIYGMYALYARRKQAEDTHEYVITCIDCGSMASTQLRVVHHESCAPGNSDRWVEYHTERKEQG